MESFRQLGFSSRNELTMRRVPPPAAATPYAEMEQGQLRKLLASQLPLWVHNIITDLEFPGRDRLIKPLRRFEGELADRRGDEVISTVLSRGFSNQNFDPLNLPADMGTKERCAIIAHVQPWKEAYRALEADLLNLLCQQPAQLDEWIAAARESRSALIE
jgi:hypothetical protein